MYREEDTLGGPGKHGGRKTEAMKVTQGRGRYCDRGGGTEMVRIGRIQDRFWSELTRFPDELDAGCQGKRGDPGDSYAIGPSN